MKCEVSVLRIVVLAFLSHFGMFHASSSPMKYADSRCEDDFLAEFPDSSAEIDILIVEEKPLVESVYSKEKLSRNGKCGTAHPCDRSGLPRIPKRCAFRETEMIAEYAEERDLLSCAPRLRSFRLYKEFHADYSDGRMLVEYICDVAHISRKKTRVGIEKHEYISFCAFGAAIYGVPETVILGE